MNDLGKVLDTLVAGNEQEAQTMFKDMIKKARCSRYGSKNILQTQIIYVSNGAIASLGSAMRPHSER